MSGRTSQKFIIEGGLKMGGEVEVVGAKNAALKIIPASLLSFERIVINNLPDIEDVNRALELVKDLGAEVNRRPRSVEINPKGHIKNELNPEIAKKFRASIVFVGPMLARLKQVRFPFPGGCLIASGSKRPIDLFLEGFKAFGAKVETRDGYFELQAKELKGCNYFFTNITVTGTETLLMLAVLAKGKTILKNCACEPEISALADYLNKCGAKISGAGTPVIKIEGVDGIKAGSFNIIPDRIETGTFAITAAASQSDITIKNCDPEHIEVLLNIFDRIGVSYSQGDDWLRIKGPKKIKPFDIKTHEYPGFPTDLQSVFTVLMTQAQGLSLIHETIYDRRLMYVDMLMQMGADIIMCDPHRIVVNGPTRLKGRSLLSPDLRAGVAMIVAGLIAEGRTEISNIYQIDRGHENIDTRLQKLGANIKRV